MPPKKCKNKAPWQKREIWEKVDDDIDSSNEGLEPLFPVKVEMIEAKVMEKVYMAMPKALISTYHCFTKEKPSITQNLFS